MKYVAFDTETRGLDWFDSEQQAFIATWSTAEDDGPITDHIAFHDAYASMTPTKGEPIQNFLDALQEADVIIAHNFSFDFNQVKATWGFDILKDTTAGRNGQLVDTDLMSRVLLPDNQRDGRGGHGLKNLAVQFIDSRAAEAEDDIKKMAKQSKIKLKETGGYFETWRAYPEIMEKYAKLDAQYTLVLYRKFKQMEAQNPQAAKVIALEHACMPVLIRAENTGVALDPAKVDALDTHYTVLRNQRRQDLESELGQEALGGAGSEGALLEALQMQGVPLYRKTPTGQLATNAYALQEFEDDHPVIAMLQEYRNANKFLSTYIGPMVGRDTVHCNFRQIGAWTGRMSCARPNMQNIPVRAGSEVREMFVPREGCVFVVADYDSIEMRILAHYLNDPGFQTMISDGHDPHAWMASMIWGGEPDDYAKGTPGEKQRSIAKNTLFAITYGAGARRVSDMNKMDMAEAKALVATIKSSLPNYKRLMGRVQKKIKTVGYVNTLFGRVNTVPRDKAYVGLNALIQGSAADVMKKGVIEIDKAIADVPDAQLLLVVHDEAVVECRAEDAKMVQDYVEFAMVNAIDINPELAVTSTVAENSYAEAK